MKNSNKDFTFKINRYLDNPFEYTLEKLCLEFGLSESEVKRIILDNEFHDATFPKY